MVREKDTKSFSTFSHQQREEILDELLRLT